MNYLNFIKFLGCSVLKIKTPFSAIEDYPALVIETLFYDKLWTATSDGLALKAPKTILSSVSKTALYHNYVRNKVKLMLA